MHGRTFIWSSLLAKCRQLKRTATDKEEQNGTLVTETLRKNFYVDDCLRSVNSEGTAVELIEGIRQSCKKGGFRLTKFTSNRRAVRESIPVDERSKEVKFIALECDNLPVERVLGIRWCIQSDRFGFRIVVNSKPFTRRGSCLVFSLSLIPWVSLPLSHFWQRSCYRTSAATNTFTGMTAFWKTTAVNGKDGVQNFRCWSNFTSIGVRGLQTLPSGFKKASLGIWMRTAYLRLRNESNRIHCSLLMGKSRLTTTKVVTVPLLEITTATVSVRVGQMLHEELEAKPETITCHTDSTTVLRYIGNEQKKF